MEDLVVVTPMKYIVGFSAGWYRSLIGYTRDLLDLVPKRLSVQANIGSEEPTNSHDH
jgi:hypothetical protein